ncbi:MAG TPA: tyrosine-type recombinase/integrase [Polyangiaceae bacterium]|jgi:integrase
MGRRAARKVWPRGDTWWGYIQRDRGRGSRESLGLPVATCSEEDALAVWLERSRGQRKADVSANTPRVGTAFDAYIASQRRRGRPESTIEICEDKAGHFRRLWSANRPLRTIDAALVAKYIETREREGAAPRTIARELVVLRGALKLAIHLGTFTTPLERVMPIDFAPKYKPRERWLTQEHALAMFEALPEERRGWFAFALATGARRSEVERARIEDIDDALVYIRGTKTAASAGSVSIVSLQAPWLERARTHAEREGTAFPHWSNVLRGLDHARLRLETCPKCRAGKGPNCIGPNGNKLFRGTPDPECRACEAMPKIGKISPNDLRRSLGMWLRNAGVEPHLIGKVLRHVNSRMAELVYARGSQGAIGTLIETQIRAHAVPQNVPQRRKRTGRARPMRRRKARKSP